MMQLYFFKKKSIFFILLLWGFAMQAQQNINQDYSNKINQAFSGLDRNRVPYGLLLDFAMDFTNVKAFNGQLSDSTNLDRMTYTNLYHTMLLSRVRNVTTGFLLPQLFASTWEEHRRIFHTMCMDFSALFYQYPLILANNKSALSRKLSSI